MEKVNVGLAEIIGKLASDRQQQPLKRVRYSEKVYRFFKN
jgi:hypothetical protein